MATEAEKPKHRYPEVGAVNVLEATLGQRGKGKSTHQCARVAELVQEYGNAYVLGHSLGARMPSSLPDELVPEGMTFKNGKLPLEYHHNLRELKAAIAKRPSNWHIIAPPSLGDPRRGVVETNSADDLIKYSMFLSQSLRDREYSRAKLRGERPLLDPKIRDYNGLAVPPVIVVIDEGVAVKGAGTMKGDKAKRENEWFIEWLYSLRHMHTVLLYAVQNPGSRSWYILAEATEIDVFYIRHQWALGAVQAAGATSEQIDEIRSLPPHEYVVIDDISASPAMIEAAAKRAGTDDETDE